MKQKSEDYFSIVLIALLTIFFSCSQNKFEQSGLYPLQTVIPIHEPADEQMREFKLDRKSELITVEDDDKKTISGYRTTNKLFLEKVITPLITPHLAELSKKQPVEIINTLTLFGFEIYQKYFGRNFYRWGGDILDLDDPQDRSVRYQYSFGLDCSGLSAMPYELAAYYNLLKPDQLLFSSKGYEKYCAQNDIKDVGGINGSANNFRLDTQEMAELGREVFKIEKGDLPTEEQIKLLQPGDIVGRSGHFGIIAEIRGEPYYFESGGWVVPKNDGIPVKAFDALRIFASSGAITVRRCLDSNQ